MLRKFSFWIFAVGLFTSFVAEASAQAPAPAAAAPAPVRGVEGAIYAKRVRGTVTAQDNATKATRPLKEGDEIKQGVTVITGKSRDSSVVLVFSNGAKVNLAADSILNIEEYLTESSTEQIDVATLVAEPNSSSTKLHLAQGELVGNVVKLNRDRGSQFIVQTPVGAAGIRGTTFRVTFRPDPANPGHYTFSVSKPEGNVNVTMQGATGTVSAPVSVADNREVVVSVQGTVNATTGQITVTAPPQIITQSIPPTTAAIITTAAVQAVEAAQAVVVPPTPTTTTPTTTTPAPTTPAPTDSTTTTTPSTTTPTPTTPTTTPAPPAPPPVQAPPRTTSGAGG
jgi:FecR protein